MADVRYRRHIDGEYATLRAPNSPVSNDIRRRTGAVNVGALREAPVGRTVPADEWSRGRVGGNLKRNIRSEIENTPIGTVGHVIADVSYAEFVHEGTPTHPITPRRKRNLRWRLAPGYSDEVFSRGVVHPGYRGNPFLTRALREAQR